MVAIDPKFSKKVGEELRSGGAKNTRNKTGIICLEGFAVVVWVADEKPFKLASSPVSEWSWGTMSATNRLKPLPPLAGIASFAEAQKKGLPVAESVARLKRYYYAFRQLHEIFLARLTAEPLYELKMAFSLHAFYCAEHASSLRLRIGEMREPPLGLDVVPSEALAVFFAEILAAPKTGDLLEGIYGKALPSLISALELHERETNPLADFPTVRLIKFAIIELREMASYGEAARQSIPFESVNRRQEWDRLLDDCLGLAGGIAGGDLPRSCELSRCFSGKPFEYDKIPQRDDRFPDPYNMGVNAEAFLYDPLQPAGPKVLMMFYKRLREIDVPEVMASIITETKGQPWGYYRDLTRQIWDEARHAMMGEVGFISIGIDWTKVMINFTWSLGLNSQLTAKERHGVLYFIEQGLMPKTGKRFEWETAKAAGDSLSTLFQDYDWADEVLHARIGRDWYVSQFSTPKEALEWGDRAWSKVLIGWQAWRDSGLTAHRNWWPELYLEWCRLERIAPVASALNFKTTYETQRADLQSIQ